MPCFRFYSGSWWKKRMGRGRGTDGLLCYRPVYSRHYRHQHSNLYRVQEKEAGWGIIATLGFVFPSIIIITLIAAFMRNFASLEIVSRAFSGIRICVCALITDAVLKLYKKAVIDKLSVGIFLVVLLLSLFTKVPSAVIVVAAGLFGYLTLRKETKRHDDGN